MIYETKHFDQLKESTWKLVRNYCYSREYWTNHNFELDRTRISVMLEAVNAKWNDQWTLEQINWIEKRYDVISREFRMRKKKLTNVNVDVSDSVESQLRRDIRFQTSQNQLQSYNIQHRSQQQLLISSALASQTVDHSYSIYESRSKTASAYESRKSTINQSSNFSKKLILLDKIYRNDDKFDEIDDNFEFKLMIFQNKCRRVDLFQEAYIQDAFIMLIEQTQTHFYANV
jgi:hypothetical protein